jgi:hypothetical protein
MPATFILINATFAGSRSAGEFLLGKFLAGALEKFYKFLRFLVLGCSVLTKCVE